MAGAWLGGGVAIIVAVLFFCALLPRTNAEIKLSQVPRQRPAETRSSRYSVGRGGAKERSSEKDRSVTEGRRQKAEGSRQTGKEGGQKGGEQGKGAGDNKGSEESKQQSEQTSQGQAPAEGQKQAQDKSQDQSSANGPTPASDQPPSQGPSSSNTQQPMNPSQGAPKTAEQQSAPPDQSPPNQSPPDKSSPEQGEKNSAQQPDEAAPPPEAPAPSPVDSAGDWLSMFQRVFYLLLIVGGAYGRVAVARAGHRLFAAVGGGLGGDLGELVWRASGGRGSGLARVAPSPAPFVLRIFRSFRQRRRHALGAARARALYVRRLRGVGSRAWDRA